MNLLAHAVLSPDDPEVLFGNLTADWVKGRARGGLPEGVRRGMELHQRIDGFTDRHPAVGRCAGLLEPAWGRYAPILVDVLLDHVLSVEWERWCTVGRREFIARVYAAARRHEGVLPERARYAVQMLLADDWLTCYASLDGIALSFSRMSARLNERGHAVELAPAVADFRVHREAFHAAFGEFFPELRRHVEETMKHEEVKG